MEDKSTICNLLWSHATVDVTGEVRPCCRFKELDYKLPHLSSGFKTAWTSDTFNDIRARMISGEKLPNCSKCWDQERATGKSLRTLYNERYPDAIEDHKVKFLEIGFSTHCNLACRICSEQFSSKWFTIKNPSQSVALGYDLDLSWFDIDLSEINEIKIVGGEPMMARQHDDFLALLLKTTSHIKDVKLTYYTNGTVLPSQKVIDYWKTVGEVVLNISIDGLGTDNDYQRPGSEWHVLDSNVEYYHALDLPNLKIYSHSVITVLNLWKFHDFYDWHRRFFWENYMGIDVPDYPEHLALRNMPEELKEKARVYIAEHQREFPESHAKLILEKINQAPMQQTTLEEIQQKEKLLDDYFGQRGIL